MPMFIRIIILMPALPAPDQGLYRFPAGSKDHAGTLVIGMGGKPIKEIKKDRFCF